MGITDPPVAQLAYKTEHHSSRVGFEPSVNGENANSESITRKSPPFSQTNLIWHWQWKKRKWTLVR